MTFINTFYRVLFLLSAIILLGVALFWFSVRDQISAQGIVYELPFTYGFKQPNGAVVGEFIELRGDFINLSAANTQNILEMKPFKADQNVTIKLPRKYNNDFVVVYKFKIVASDIPATPKIVATGQDAILFLSTYKKPAYVTTSIIKQPNGEELLSELTVIIDEE